LQSISASIEASLPKNTASWQAGLFITTFPHSGSGSRNPADSGQIDREAFRIIHNWSKADTSSFDFKIVCESLAERLAVTTPTASSIRNRLCVAGTMRQTA